MDISRQRLRRFSRFGIGLATLIGTGAILAAASLAGASTVPGSPTSPAAVPGPKLGEVKLTWSAPVDLGGGLTTYLVASAPVVGGTTGTFSAATPTNSVALRASKTCTATYPDLCAYKIFAKNSAGTSVASTEARIVWTAPSAPGSLRAVSTNFSDVDLTWKAPSRSGGLASTFSVEKRIDGGSWAAVSSGLSGLTYTASSSCTGGTSCMYRVKAVNAVGAGPWSNSAALRVTPGAPKNLTVAVSATHPETSGALAGAAETLVEWLPPTLGLADSNYDVQTCLELCNANTGTWSASTTVATGATPNLAGECGALQHTCSYRVRSTNTRGGVSPWVYRAISPFSPTAVSVTTGSAENTIAVTFSGAAETGVGPASGRAYRFYACEASCGSAGNWITDPSEEITLDTISAYPHTATIACTGGTNCLVRMQTVYADFNGSTLTGITSAVGALLPGDPTGTTVVTGSTSGSVDVSWTAPVVLGSPALTHYDTRYSIDAGLSFTAWSSTGGTGVTRTIACGAGNTCDVEVRAANAIGESLTDSGSAVAASAPGAPTAMTVVTGTTSGTVDASWTDPADLGTPALNHYETRYSVDAGSTFSAWSSNGGTGTTRTISCGAANTCIVQVRAVNTIGASSPDSDTAVAASAPSQPTGFSAVLNTGSGNADLAWTAPTVSPSITDYEYSVSTDSGSTWGTWTSLTTTGTSASIAACSSTSADTCDYKIRAVNSIGDGASSSTSGFIIP
ncbi:MAG: fibronectin type III domain-containing protein [Actinomycetes bacterium]